MNLFHFFLSVSFVVVCAIVTPALAAAVPSRMVTDSIDVDESILISSVVDDAAIGMYSFSDVGAECEAGTTTTRDIPLTHCEKQLKGIGINTTPKVRDGRTTMYCDCCVPITANNDSTTTAAQNHDQYIASLRGFQVAAPAPASSLAVVPKMTKEEDKADSIITPSVSDIAVRGVYLSSLSSSVGDQCGPGETSSPGYECTRCSDRGGTIINEKYYPSRTGTGGWCVGDCCFTQFKEINTDAA